MVLLRRHGLFGLALVSGVGWAAMSASDDPYALIPGLLALVFACAGVTVQSLRIGTLATALLALLSNAYLLSNKVANAGESACNLDTTINCDVVNQSVYSEVAGVPITLFGVAFYAGLIVAAWMSRASDDEGRFDQLNALFALATVAYSVFLAWASKQIGAFCVVCITIYLCNGILLAAGLAGLKRAKRGLFDGLGDLATHRSTTSLLVTFGVVLLVGVPECTVDGQDTLTVDVDAPDAGQRLASLYRAPSGPLEILGSEPRLGPADAPYTVVEFADFGCPHCARAKAELEDLIEARDDVRVLFKAFPLDGACNPALQSSGQQPSPRCEATKASMCAHAQGRFWPFATQLFTNQGYFAPDQLAFMAEEVGLDMEAFGVCMRDEATEARVLQDARAGGAAEIRGTPALFLYGLTGDDPVEITRGVPAVLQLIEAHADGVSLPAP